MEPEADRDEVFDFAINEQTCAWTVRAMSALRSRLSVDIRLHHREGLLDDGQIFLFNHFARFETFIPQYLLHLHTGVFCRSIAANEFFKEGDSFSDYLIALGGVPNNHPRLLPFLAEEILKGRKIVIFPEGGMVKDRRVIDTKGDYSIYSRSALQRRKHHTGGVVLALTLDAFKVGIREIGKSGDTAHLERWSRILELGGVDELLAACRQPTLIVPSNITFHPLRASDNLLKKSAAFFTRGLNQKITEELLIEGNILLKDTDMDIRMDESAAPARHWRWWQRRILGHVVRNIDTIDDLFARGWDGGRKNWIGRLVSAYIGRRVYPLRDACMRGMYEHVTINLSHLASRLIMMFVERGQTEVDCDTFHTILYLAIKNAQKNPSIHLHRGLLDPDAYGGIRSGICRDLERFVSSKACAELIVHEDGVYRFLPKLREEHPVDEIRLENLIAVYANEMAPNDAACGALTDAAERVETTTGEDLARHSFDDALLSHRSDKEAFSDSRHGDINLQETATESGEPFLLMPGQSNGVGVVLVHGFLASPAEVREFAEKLVAAGHPVIGVRLKGHGTSPWDLRERGWRDWLASVREGYDIMAALAGRVCLVGFSTGGALSLILAAETPEKLAGVVAVCSPLKFRNKNLIFVPLVHGANKLSEWLPSFEGIMPFRQNDSEHPHINYRNIAIHALYELQRMVDDLKRRLAKVTCPALIVQGDGDTVVHPKSAEIIHRKLGSADKSLHMVRSARHGILNENIDGTHDAVMAFIASLPRSDVSPVPEPHAAEKVNA